MQLRQFLPQFQVSECLVRNLFGLRSESQWRNPSPSTLLGFRSDSARTQLGLGTEIWLVIQPKQFLVQSERTARTPCGQLRFRSDSARIRWGSVKSSIFL